MRRSLFHLDNGEIDLTERFQVGVITTPHGLKGEVKVFPTTDDPGRFRVLRELILKEKKSERVLKARSCSTSSMRFNPSKPRITNCLKNLTLRT